MSTQNTVRRVLSGIQPTGVPTLGNYLGAMRTWVKLQDFFEERQATSKESRVLYMVADLHSLTTQRNPSDLQEAIVGLTSTMLACGIDPKKSSLFQQSMIPGHSELAWILQCHTPMGWLNRMTQFKDKSKGKESPDVGLYVYPALMAADILLYDASHVPVGDDQTQHLEFTRDIASRMNELYGSEMFLLPNAIYSGGGVERVMSLRDGKKKMSKSDLSDYSRINMNDTADMVEKKIRKAKTDTLGPITSSVDLKTRPELENLLNIMAALTNNTVDSLLDKYEGLAMQDLKKDLTEVLVETICPIGLEIERLRQDRQHLASVLRAGADVASDAAQGVLDRVKSNVGLDILHNLK